MTEYTMLHGVLHAREIVGADWDVVPAETVLDMSDLHTVVRTILAAPEGEQTVPRIRAVLERAMENVR